MSKKGPPFRANPTGRKNGPAVSGHSLVCGGVTGCASGRD